MSDHGYTVKAVEVRDCLHLKTACTYVGRATLVANPNWVDTGQIGEFDVIEVDDSEPFAGNALAANGRVLFRPPSQKRRSGSKTRALRCRP